MLQLSEITTEEIYALSDCNPIQLIVKDAVFNESDLQSLLSDIQTIDGKNKLSAAKMGARGTSVIGSDILRGDRTCWITPDLCKEFSLLGLKAYVQMMIKFLKPFQHELGLIADYSIQCAIYPGNGSGYVKHLDCSIPHNGIATTKRGRKLTAILYLNKESKGGQLRVHIPQTSSIKCAATCSKSVIGSKHENITSSNSSKTLSTSVATILGNLQDNFPGSKNVGICATSLQHIDIDPNFGRIVIFRSDTMEHEVLPCYTDRRALTFWISADYSNKSQSNSSALSASSNPPNGFLYRAIKDIDGSNKVGGNLSPPPQPQHQRGPKNSIRKPLDMPNNILPFSLDSDHWNKKTIFVSIASYCDSECGITIQDLFQQASYPERIFVGVAWQGEMKGEWEWVTKDSPGVNFMSSSRPSSDDDGKGAFDYHSKEESWRKHLKANTRVAAIPLEDATGPCWARGVAFSLWRGEHYLLQIDSHMRFRPGWDSYLIWQLEMKREDMILSNHEQLNVREVTLSLKKGIGRDKDDGTQHLKDKQINGITNHSKHGHGHRKMKPVLTTYPLGYQLPNCIPDDTRPTLLVPSHFDSSGMLRQSGRVIRFPFPLPEHLLSSHPNPNPMPDPVSTVTPPNIGHLISSSSSSSSPSSSPSLSSSSSSSSSSPCPVNALSDLKIITKSGPFVPKIEIDPTTSDRIDNVTPTSVNSTLSPLKVERKMCIESPLWASGFSFSDSSLLVEVPYDPRLSYLFFGEEISLAARFYTHGYDFFAPPEAVVYHLWTRSHRPAFYQDALQMGISNSDEGRRIRKECRKEEMGEAEQEKQRQQEEVLREIDKLRVQNHRETSEKFVRSLLGVGAAPSLDVSCPVEKRYGLGAVRSISEFEDKIGVNFSTLTVREFVPSNGVHFTADDVSSVLSALSLSVTETSVDSETVESVHAPMDFQLNNNNNKSSNDTLDALHLVRAYLLNNR